jgi:hypothetical protein
MARPRRLVLAALENGLTVLGIEAVGDSLRVITSPMKQPLRARSVKEKVGKAAEGDSFAHAAVREEIDRVLSAVEAEDTQRSSSARPRRQASARAVTLKPELS